MFQSQLLECVRYETNINKSKFRVRHLWQVVLFQVQVTSQRIQLLRLEIKTRLSFSSKNGNKKMSKLWIRNLKEPRL